MSHFLSLKEDSLEHRNKLLLENSKTKNCQVIGRDGKGLTCTLLLAAVSPWLKELLSATPPYIDGCIILPDIDWSEIWRFLSSLSQTELCSREWSHDLVKLLGVTTIIDVAKEEVQDDGGEAIEAIEINDHFLDVKNLDEEAESFKDNDGDAIENNFTECSSISCHHCEKFFESEARLKVHVKRNHEEESIHANVIKTENDVIGDFKCDICQRYFDTESGLNVHNSVKHTDVGDPNFVQEGGRFKCLLCGKELPSRGKMRFHLKLKHKLGASFKCEFCNEVFPYKYTLEDHRKTHTQEKTFFCDECGEGFIFSQKLNRHKQRVHLSEEEKEKLKKHKCHICGSAYVFESKLKIHMECHVQARTYSCEFCGKAYRTLQVLQAHTRKTHTNPQKRKPKTSEEKALMAARLRRYRALKTGKIQPHQSVPGDERFGLTSAKKLLKIL